MLQGNWCHVGAVIGRGGNASVRRLSSPFWLKAVVKTGVQGQLRREGNMMGCVHHPAVARVFALLREHKSEPNNKKKGYLVMEKLGASLLVALDQLTQDAAARGPLHLLAAGLSPGLGAPHEAGAPRPAPRQPAQDPGQERLPPL